MKKETRRLKGVFKYNFSLQTKIVLCLLFMNLKDGPIKDQRHIFDILMPLKFLDGEKGKEINNQVLLVTHL